MAMSGGAVDSLPEQNETSTRTAKVSKTTSGGELTPPQYHQHEHYERHQGARQPNHHQRQQHQGSSPLPASPKSSHGVGGVSGFPFGEVPNLGPDSGFNPFRNTSTPLLGFTEIVKTIVCLPLFLVRVVLFLLFFVLGYAWVSVALCGADKELTRPFPAWRRRLMHPVRWCARGLLFCLGYHWIHVKGKPAPRDVAPIVVANHVAGFVDGIFVFYYLLPVIVSAKENLEYPVLGTILRVLQIISVERLKPSSRKDCLAEVKRRALCNDWPHVTMFPEATTTNGRALVSFRTGAFVPGMPVQPLVFKYPHVKFDPCWVVEGPGIPMLLFRMMTQFVNFMEVEYLPVVVPTSKEKRNPLAFAERTRLLMARALNVVCTEHTYGDVALAMNAAKLKTPSHSAMVEFGKMEKLFQLDLATAKEYLEKFMAMDVSKSGKLTMDEFLQALELPDNEFTRPVFFLFDRNERGYIYFREFVAGLAFISKHTSFSKSIEAAFRAFDKNGDGLLSRPDIEHSFRAIFPAIEDAQFARLFDLLDMDRDGQIKWQEFKSFLEKHPEYLAVIMTARPDLLDEAMDLQGEGGPLCSGQIGAELSSECKTNARVAMDMFEEEKRCSNVLPANETSAREPSMTKQEKGEKQQREKIDQNVTNKERKPSASSSEGFRTVTGGHTCCERVMEDASMDDRGWAVGSTRVSDDGFKRNSCLMGPNTLDAAALASG